jgi:hypothetical protein
VAEPVKPGDDSVEPREVVVHVWLGQQSRCYADMQASHGTTTRSKTPTEPTSQRRPLILNPIPIQLPNLNQIPHQNLRQALIQTSDQPVRTQRGSMLRALPPI